jgi:hypothetical protein
MATEFGPGKYAQSTPEPLNSFIRNWRHRAAFFDNLDVWVKVSENFQKLAKSDDPEVAKMSQDFHEKLGGRASGSRWTSPMMSRTAFSAGQSRLSTWCIAACRTWRWMTVLSRR